MMFPRTKPNAKHHSELIIMYFEMLEVLGLGWKFLAVLHRRAVSTPGVNKHEENENQKAL